MNATGNNPNRGSYPLVSVRIHNFNYGRFLKSCVESTLEQSYPNIEISFSDNCSSDESWEIVLSFQKKYPNRFNLAKNRINFGPDANVENCIFPSQGQYAIQLCSDDVMASDFVEKAVSVLEKHPDCAFAMVHRGIIDDDGQKYEEPPFYKDSCIVCGEDQAAVYMMAAVNPSISQIMYRTEREAAVRDDFSKVIAGRWYGARIMDFLLCCRYNMAYLKDPLLFHRLHGQNDSQQAAGNLIEILGPYLLHQYFYEIAGLMNMKKVTDRLTPSLEKLSSLCFRYATRFLLKGDYNTGEQYYYLGLAIYPENRHEKIGVLLSKFWAFPEYRKEVLDQLLGETNLVERKTSYDPPTGSIILSN